MKKFTKVMSLLLALVLVAGSTISNVKVNAATADSCFTYTCGKREHQHHGTMFYEDIFEALFGDCYLAGGILICRREEHTHTENCKTYHHDYKAEVTGATCTEGGYTTYTCTRCKDSYTVDETNALGHDYKAEVTDATCTEGGYTTHTCSRCENSYTDTETNALDHKAAQEVKENVVAATYDSKGSYDVVVYCSVCDEVLSRDTFETDMLVREVLAGPIVPIIYDYVAPVIEVEEVETPKAAVEETVEEVVEKEPVVEETVEEAAEEETVVEIEETETPEAAVEETVEEEVEEEPVVEEEEEELDVDVIETPQGDVLPQTGIASAAVLYGFGAMLAGVGGTVAIKARRKED